MTFLQEDDLKKQLLVNGSIHFLIQVSSKLMLQGLKTLVMAHFHLQLHLQEWLIL